MKNKIIDNIEKEQLKESVPDINVGDTVVVHKTIVEGKKKRIQRFQGTIIKIKGSNSRKSFTVRKIIDGVGVEKIFLIHSKLVDKVEILKRSKVRRSKLYYLRERVGSKANRLKPKDIALEVKQESTEGKIDTIEEPVKSEPKEETESSKTKEEDTQKEVVKTEETKTKETKSDS